MSGTWWRVFTQVIDGRKMYIAGRKRDTSQPLHGGNVEYYGGYSDNRDSVEARVAELNAAEDL